MRSSVNSLVVRHELQEKINNNQSILGTKVFSVSGGFCYHEGIVRELSVYDHRILGTLVQVWVEWFNHEGEDFYTKGYLTPYQPNQFKKWEDSSAKIGVYYECEQNVC